MKQKEIKTAPRKSLADQVYEEILSRILNLDLKPKQQVSAAELAEELGVSRTPLREAFQKLEGDGVFRYCPAECFFGSSFATRCLSQGTVSA